MFPFPFPSSMTPDQPPFCNFTNVSIFYPPFILTFQKLGILLQFYCSGSCKIQIKEKEVCFGGRVWVGYLISSKGDSRKTHSFYITRKLSLAHNFSKRVCLVNDKVNSLNAVVGSSFPLYGIDFFSFSCSESTGLLKIYNGKLQRKPFLSTQLHASLGI